MRLKRAELDARVADYVLGNDTMGLDEPMIWWILICARVAELEAAYAKPEPWLRSVRGPREQWIIDRLYVPLRGKEVDQHVVLYERADAPFVRRRRWYVDHVIAPYDPAGPVIVEACKKDPDRVCYALGNLDSAVWWRELERAFTGAIRAAANHSAFASDLRRASSG